MSMHVGTDLLTESAMHGDSGVLKGMGSSYEKTNVHSISLYDSYLGQEEEKVEKAPLAETTMNVLILAGSFGKKLVGDIAASSHKVVSKGGRTDGVSGGGGDRRHMGTHTMLVRGGGGKEHIPKAMIKLAGTTVIEHLLIMLRKCDRLQPTESSMYIVTNEPGKVEMDVWTEEADVQFPKEHILSNGLSDPDSKHSHMADVKLAVDHFGLGSKPLLVISADLVFYQDYNFQRVVEHSFMRGTDVCGFYSLYDGQMVAEPYGESHAVVTPAEGRSVVKVKKFEAHPPSSKKAAAGGPKGECVAAPLFLLKKSTMATELDPFVAAGSPGDIYGFLEHLSTLGPFYGVDLEFGRFDVARLGNLLYAEAFLDFYMREKHQLNTKARVSDTDSSITFKTQYSNMGDGSKYNSVLASTQVKGRGDIAPQMQKLLTQFIQGFFEVGDARVSGAVKSITPEQFYVTEYRRVHCAAFP
mmetsp:Transcript_28443/g.92892  ORF Transcript_28443/g.92892 Transcript_28443/m.92892 type:complete len:469 (-) Transcript_28443:201-1607(-)|eukprot:CAMPEP_0170134048 /NCGR_PEP_ID=MMETSP0033_2-20121228/1675_1 /TAXON_ID=195969 /ORGANISM="Dolichomastix tenuilepis, Strain CCMP3274" /LENGTH=468 /DNA_ID=CAMNT_0010369583 /DNA_START=32 /DNA_END=1438 /DNA_ORIENTATION=+